MEDHVDSTTKLLKYFKRTFYFSVIVVAVFALFTNEVIVLNASTGSQKHRLLEEKETNNYIAQVEVEILIEEIDIANPTSGCIGFLDAETKSDSFQLCVARMNTNQQYYTVGYSIIKNGEGVKFEEISKSNLGELVKFTIEYKEGLALIDLEKHGSIRENTNLNSIIPFVTATSGQVRFEFIK